METAVKDNENIDRILFSQDILEKKFGLYQWLSSQNSVLMAINTLLLGCSFVLVKDLSQKCKGLEILAVVGAGVITLSIFMCIFAAIPTMKSSAWKKYKNRLISKTPRTVIGIRSYDPLEYANTLRTISHDDMIIYNADEIFKANSNIYQYRNWIKTSAITSCVGLLLLFIALIFTL